MITKNDTILVLDTETANTLTRADGSTDMSDVLVYDCGWMVTNREGKEIDARSYVNYDIYRGERELMQSAYYADKIPRYEADLAEGTRKMVTFNTILRELAAAIEEYNIKYFAAYNARFDANALNRTISYLTKSKRKWALPFGKITWLDIMKMAGSTVVKSRDYKTWAADRDYLMKNGAPRKTAEMVYQFITGDESFEESHTGLEDVRIETFIMMHCFEEAKRKHIKLDTLLWPKARESPQSTEFQRNLMTSLKYNPTINMGR